MLDELGVTVSPVSWHTVPAVVEDWKMGHIAGATSAVRSFSTGRLTPSGSHTVFVFRASLSLLTPSSENDAAAQVAIIICQLAHFPKLISKSGRTLTEDEPKNGR